MILSPNEFYENITEELSKLSSFDEVAKYWARNNENLTKTTIAFSFDDTGSQVPLQRAVGSFDDDKIYLRSILCRSNVYFFNDELWACYKSRTDYFGSIENVLLVDTQVGNYAKHYLNDESYRNKPEGINFRKVLCCIYEKRANFNFMFYLLENYPNFITGDCKQIIEQIRSLKHIVNCDGDRFIDSGELVLNCSKDDLENQVNDIVSTYSNVNFRKDMALELRLQSTIACMLLKTVLLKNDNKLSSANRVSEIVKFADKNLSEILLRELIVCIKYLNGSNVTFFDPVNTLNAQDIPRKINGMAWDMMLLRCLDKVAATRTADPYRMPYFLSFDRRLVETHDIFDNKGWVKPDPNIVDRIYMISGMNIEKFLNETIGQDLRETIFDVEAQRKRSCSKPEVEEIFTLRRQLEYKAIKSSS